MGFFTCLCWHHTPHPGTPNILGLLNPRLSMGLALPRRQRLGGRADSQPGRSEAARVSTPCWRTSLPIVREEKCLLTAAAL